VSSPIPTLREYGEFLESLDTPLDIDALLAVEGLPSAAGLVATGTLLADTARDLDVLEPDDFEEVVDFEPAGGRRVGRRRWLVAAAAAVALLLVVGSVLVQRAGDDTKTERPAGTDSNPTTTDAPPPPDAQAVAAATGFVDAVDAFDADRAIGYLADDADISPMFRSVGATNGEATRVELRLLFSLLQAQGYEQIVDPAPNGHRCTGNGTSDSGTRLRCTFARDGRGLTDTGTYAGSRLWVTVRDGEIARAAMYFQLEGFSAEIWEPFADWVATTYPDDVEAMYTDATQREARLTDASIRLWERHTNEYGGAARDYVGQVRSICWSTKQRVAVEGATEFYDESWGRILDDALPELRALPRPAHPLTDPYDHAFDIAEQFAADMRSGNVDVDVIHELELIPAMLDCRFHGPS
jgi:hypothetical protein